MSKGHHEAYFSYSWEEMVAVNCQHWLQSKTLLYVGRHLIFNFAQSLRESPSLETINMLITHHSYLFTQDVQHSHLVSWFKLAKVVSSENSSYNLKRTE